ncbi:SDR family oxidoreductase [Hymenobacter busanensis]|uniref:SDR family oxidoreductase n=1 Tax=Hymenobacter busanensis TaxID=2607656 RepID=A0A7L5A0J0_9BACT|nr:SDR family oxidoreductase [Hymenobacter busanensis]KAA9331352.1 SDR family oxidoreductase [Hymenobacter busanensis]QHJ08505.1 SDR family oxidoreductase [Hymenobacter busanensis]
MLTELLSSRRAVVCGSTQGIGRAVAELLAARHATVTLVARDEAKLREVLAALPTPAGQTHDFVVADFSRPAEVAERMGAWVQQHGPAHILVNNTGGPAGGPLLAASVDALRAAFEQHVICNHLLAQALVPGMQAAGYGRIINVISTSVKQPLPNLGVSNTTRGAVANWAKTLATELAPHGITVNNVLPGATLTQRHHSLLEARSASTGQPVEALEENMRRMIPAGRFAEAEEVAAAVAFLASPMAGYINGINVPVDGGRTGSL